MAKQEEAQTERNEEPEAKLVKENDNQNKQDENLNENKTPAE